MDRGVTEELPDEEISDGTTLLSQLQFLNSGCNNLFAAEPNSPAAVIDSEEKAGAAKEEDFDEQREQEESEDRLNDKLPVEEEEQDRREIESEAGKEPETAASMTDQEFTPLVLGVNHVTIGYRWTSVREGQLVGALVEKKVRTQARTMIDKIKAHLTVLAAAPDGE